MFTWYNVLPITLGLLVLYGVSFALYRTRRIKVSTHRRIWNVLLVVSFVVSCALGFVLTVRRDYALIFSFPVNIIFWHVETGIALTVIGVFHMGWHMSYYRELFKSFRAKLDGTGRNESAERAGEGVCARGRS
jgi:hypothetical protein